MSAAGWDESVRAQRPRAMVAPAELAGWRADGLVNYWDTIGDGWDLVHRDELAVILARHDGVTAASVVDILDRVDHGRTVWVLRHGWCVAPSVADRVAGR